MTDQAALCIGCTGALQLDLQRIGGYRHPDGRWIPGLLDDLLTAAVGAARIPQQGGQDDDDTRRTLDGRFEATTSTAGAPGNPAAMDAWHACTNALTTWVRCLLDHLPPPCPHGSCAAGHRPPCAARATWTDPAANPARWLEARTATIRRRDWAPDMLHDLDRHLAHAEALVDLPDAITVPCPWCQRRVPVDPDAEVITCRCGCWGVLDWWIEQVAPPLPEEPMTLAEIPDWLRTRGYEVAHKQLRNWADRGQLPHRTDRGAKDARLYDAKTVLEAAERSGVRRVVPTSLTL